MIVIGNAARPGCRHQIQAGHSIAPLHDVGVENKIQVVKGPFNILQLAQDKRNQFSSPGRPASTSGSSRSSSESDNGILSFQTRRSRSPSPLCQTTSPSRRRGRATASPCPCPATAAKPTATWASSTASSLTTGSSLAQAPSLARRPTPPFLRVSRTVPRRCVFPSPSLDPDHNPPSSLLLSSSFLSSLPGLTHQTKGNSPDPTQPAVGSASPGFISTCPNSERCIIMSLSHQHNKVLYFSSTIAKLPPPQPPPPHSLSIYP